MQIGINCFKDFQLKSIIQSENHKGHCDIKNEDNVLVYDTNSSLQLFEQINIA